MGPRELYTDAYSEVYRALYIDHPQWRAKHEVNLRILRTLLRPGMSWLDTCCGQAWHFSQVDDVTKVGVDISAGQLLHARRANPGAVFHEADVLEVDLGRDRFDVVTNFWGAYSYLDDHARIRTFVERLIAWTAPGGSLYLELITPAMLAAFDRIAFAGEASASVRVRSEDGVAWSYVDPAGWHELTSPPTAWFEALLAPWFAKVEPGGVVATMQQLVATGRSEQRVVDRERG